MYFHHGIVMVDVLQPISFLLYAFWELLVAAHEVLAQDTGNGLTEVNAHRHSSRVVG
ncbi:hypothetical protein D3C79_897260 [compost metagenome]